MQDAIGYARISTDEQHSSNQILKLKEAGITVIFCDEDVRGSKPAMTRPDFRQMIKYLDEHKNVKRIVVFELSRLGRNLLDSISTFLELEQKGYFIYSLTEAWTQQQDLAMRQLMILIVSWMNEQESKRLGIRVKAGMERARLEGKVPGRPAAALDRSSVMLLHDNGKSWREIADQFKVDEATLFRYRQKWKRQDLGR